MQLPSEMLIISLVKMLFFLVHLIFVGMLVIYNSLYLSHTLRASKHIGMHPPQRIKHLVQTSTYIALFNAVLVIIFLVMGYY